MKRTTTRLCLLPCLLLGACVDVPPGAYYNRGDPENLIDVATEVVHLDMNGLSDLDELRTILRDNPPTRAELECPQEDEACSKAGAMLDKASIPANYAASSSDHGEKGVRLLYDRVEARDCENRYIDNSRNNHNLPPPTFGCSITSNMVQMVTDKRQFTNPNLRDYPDAEKAVQVHGRYMAPPADTGSNSGDSLLSTVSTGQ